MDSEDERVATIAIQGVLTWAFGKPRDYDPKDASASGLRFDITQLTLRQCLSRLPWRSSAAWRGSMSSRIPDTYRLQALAEVP